MKSTLVRTSLVALLAAATATGIQAQDESQAVEDGGIKAAGWMGQVDDREAERGNTIEDALLQMDGDAVHVKTGPSGNFWHEDHTASGEYTVTATFTEPSYMAMADHPHPYGIFIGGRDLTSDSPHLLYCSAYGDGRFIVRGFGTGGTFALTERYGHSDAVSTAEGDGPVTQMISVTVSSDAVSCSINGTEVASYPVSQVTMDGRLRSTDGQVGVRYGHNVEARITGMSITQR